MSIESQYTLNFVSVRLARGLVTISASAKHNYAVFFVLSVFIVTALALMWLNRRCTLHLKVRLPRMGVSGNVP
jgi:hypothetical protein